RPSLAPRSAPASATPSACSCPPRERSTSSQHGPPTAVRCAIARPIFAAYYGPQSNSPAAPDPRQTARCISLCSYDNYCTTPPQRESSVSLSTLVRVALRRRPRPRRSNMPQNCDRRGGVDPHRPQQHRDLASDGRDPRLDAGDPVLYGNDLALYG